MLHELVEAYVYEGPDATKQMFAYMTHEKPKGYDSLGAAERAPGTQTLTHFCCIMMGDSCKTAHQTIWHLARSKSLQYLHHVFILGPVTCHEQTVRALFDRR